MRSVFLFFDPDFVSCHCFSGTGDHRRLVIIIDCDSSFGFLILVVIRLCNQVDVEVCWRIKFWLELNWAEEA